VSAPSLGLFALRIVCGIAFVMHGWPKIRDPFGWMGPGAGMPAMLQALAALSEFAGGIAWILGLLTPIASLGIGCTMAVAVARHAMRRDPFIGGYELAAVYLFVALALLLTGPGRYSLDRALLTRLPTERGSVAADGAR
jgi:putative oxidoreductase